MRRIRLPAFIHEVIDDPRQRGILVAGALALFTVGLVPRVLSPGLPNAQEVLRTQPEIQNLFLLLAFASTAAIILGGLVSDIVRRRYLLVGGLGTIMLAALVAVPFDDGAVFYAANFASVAAAGVVLAYGIGSVAVAYQGVPRATALGVVYAAYGAGSAASPALLTMFPKLIPSTEPGVPSSFTFETWLAYVLTAIAAAVALWAAFRYVPGIPGSLPARRLLIVSVAAWTISVLAIVSGALGLGGPGSLLLPIVLVVGGFIGLSTVTLYLRRPTRDTGSLRLDPRALGAALAVGVTVGFAQAIPLMLLPVVFQYPMGYGQFFAMLAIAPFAVALLLAGPVSGILIGRYGPRGIMATGTLALGLANLLTALVLTFIAGQLRSRYAADPSGGSDSLAAADYLLFVIPLILVGAGFVVSTTVRTAIVFASTPRGLPASAAAINEASVGLGSRLGIVTATGALTLAALESARAMVAGRPRGPAMVDEFQAALVALGTPRFQEMYQTSLHGAEPVKRVAYSVAYLDGVTVALILSGVVGVAGAILAWILIGRRDPLQTVFDMQDERDPMAPSERAGEGGVASLAAPRA